MSLTFSTSRTQREVIQAQGHRGSNQKSTGVFSDMSLLMRLRDGSFVGATGRPVHPFPAAVRQGRMAGSVLSAY
ncbi:hypothetical protein GCM10023257_64690 [Streptomyces hyderabadensis]|uniref:Uncharacterized protein n=1 Tax=Streptomyces hyderabadensis TaxID=598549 RepID=A0ABP9IT82_9ACTN